MEKAEDENAFVSGLENLAKYLNRSKHTGLNSDKQEFPSVSFQFKRRFQENSDGYEAAMDEPWIPRQAIFYFRSWS